MACGITLRTDGTSSSRFQEHLLRITLNNALISAILTGMYILVYFLAAYFHVTQQRQHAWEQRMVFAVTTLLFLTALAQTALQWYSYDCEFVTMGATRETVYAAIISNDSPIIHLMSNITYFGLFIISDCLMVWRCYHVWGRSWFIIAMPSILLLAELGVFLALIIDISANIHSINPAKARVFDILQIALYLIPVVISLATTYLICHRIYFTSHARNGFRAPLKTTLRKVIDIVVQSSAMYTVALLGTALVDVPMPTSQRSDTREIAYRYMATILTPIAGIAPTLMVARVGFLSSSQPDSYGGQSRPQPTSMMFQGLDTRELSGTSVSLAAEDEKPANAASV
ncbi:hypothetical protein CPC08DRAFT_715718 [Agrocybe pediades]|nr:hypothetical protein CPC08DRAFT_715718 [Agrocybe pediades]